MFSLTFPSKPSPVKIIYIFFLFQLLAKRPLPDLGGLGTPPVRAPRCGCLSSFCAAHNETPLVAMNVNALFVIPARPEIGISETTEFIASVRKIR